jgi:hypothetical protein
MIVILFVSGDQDAGDCGRPIRPLLASSADLQRPSVHLPRNQSVSIGQTIELGTSTSRAVL